MNMRGASVCACGAPPQPLTVWGVADEIPPAARGHFREANLDLDLAYGEVACCWVDLAAQGFKCQGLLAIFVVKLEEPEMR